MGFFGLRVGRARGKGQYDLGVGGRVWLEGWWYATSSDRRVKGEGFLRWIWGGRRWGMKHR